MTVSDPFSRRGQPMRPPPTSKNDMHIALEELSAHSQEWVDLSLEERIAIVEEAHAAFPKVWDRWVEYSVAAKGIDDRRAGNDREWLDMTMMCRMHSVLLRTLTEILDHGHPKVPGGYHAFHNGQVAARVYPDNLEHSLAFRGTEVDVLLEPGISMEEARAKQASAYKDRSRNGKVALVLGAGNASPLPPSDTFHKLFHDLRVVVLKMNPVNSYLGPLLEETYRGLIDRGYLRIVYGDIEEGKYLVHHDLVDEVHMTGSDRTYEAIVFGPGDQGRQRKRTGTLLVTKPVEGELGCITPWVIVPGNWKEQDIAEQAAKMAFWVMRNEGYLCFSPRILLMHQSWPLREAFLSAFVEALSEVEPIKAYYPGSAETQRTFVEAHPEAIQIGGGSEDYVPWTVIPDLDPAATDDICYRRESFSGLCGEVPIEASSVPEFIYRAVKFLNGTVWGTLSTTLVVSDASLAEPAVGEAVEQAITDLRYGTVALNVPGVWGLATMIGPWGGYPGSDIFDIQSGNEKVGNFLMLHRPQKTVVRSPFRSRPYPFLGTAKNLDVFCRKLAMFEFEPSLRKLPGLVWSASRT
jgi:acyl-CoA reductase-like NAD-dependent aldehyde dehydrogenase